jgi:hypothetical protein
MAVSVDLLIKIIFTYASVVTGILTMIFIFTPVIPFLAARISKSYAPLFLISGNRMKVVLGKYFAGTLKTSKDGVFRETPGSGYLFKKVMVYFGWFSYGATLPVEYPAIVQALKEKNYPVNTYEDIKRIWSYAADQAHNLVQFGNKKVKQKDLAKVNLEYAPGKTIVLGDLQYKFPTNDNPFINEAKEACEITIERMQKGKDYFKWIIIIGGIVIIAYVAYALFKNFNAGPAVDVVCKCPSYLGNLTGEITI